MGKEKIQHQEGTSIPFLWESKLEGVRAMSQTVLQSWTRQRETESNWTKRRRL